MDINYIYEPFEVGTMSPQVLVQDPGAAIIVGTYILTALNRTRFVYQKIRDVWRLWDLTLFLQIT